jgi:membrane protease YdiL (CAAX protease family)
MGESDPPTRPYATGVPRRIAAVVAAVVITFHWLPNYWYLTLSPLLPDLDEWWRWGLASTSLALVLVIWAPRSFGLLWSRTRRERRAVSIIALTMILPSFVVMYFFVRVPFHGESCAIYVLVPLYEELLFRAFLWTILADAFPGTLRLGRSRIAVATLVTGVAFGLWHLGGFRLPDTGFIWFQVTYTTIAGALFGYLRERTGSIWSGWAVHFIVDFWAVEVPGVWAT